jgi:hypothetical protein
MESLQNFFPYGVSEDNFWMKYSLVPRWGIYALAPAACSGAKYTIIALETSDGEVFGPSRPEPWRRIGTTLETGNPFVAHETATHN